MAVAVESVDLRPSRREILGTGIGLVTAGLCPNAMTFARAQAIATSIVTRPIPHSGEQLPVVGVGTAINFDVGEDAGKRAALKGVIDRLVAGGGKVIDTAASYGTAESVVGDLISPALREKVFLATKTGGRDPGSATAEFRRSLERLRSKSVDLLQLHNVRDPNQSLAMFRDWKAQGLCRYIGVTTTFARDYDAAEAVVRREKPDFLQIDYSLADRDAENRLIPAAADVGAAVLTALPFGRNSVFRAVRGKSLPEWAKDFDAATWAQFFLKFLLGHDSVTAVIPGTNNPEHMADNLAAGRGRFPDAAERKKMIEFFAAL